TVQYATADGTATAGSDYAFTAGTLTFPPGMTSLPVTVPVFGDRVFEADETFAVNLTSPVGATLADAPGPGTITNADTAGLSSGEARAPGGARAVSTVTPSPANAAQPVPAAYATAGGSAVSGVDFTAASGTLSFAPNATTRTISVSTTADLAPEGAETFVVNL